MSMQDRTTTVERERRQLLEELLAGLRRPQKTLPSKYFYDEIGSALFEDIAVLQYPPAAASSVLLLLVVVIMISLILRTVMYFNPLRIFVPLALLFLVLIPLVTAVLIWIIRRATPMFTGVQKRLDALNTVMQENLSGVRVVKAFVREDLEEERFAERASAMRQPAYRAAFMTGFLSPLLSGISQIAIATSIWVGGQQVFAAALDIGQHLPGPGPGRLRGPVSGLLQPHHLGGLHIAHHHQGGVVGGVVELIPAPEIRHREVFQIIHPADGGLMIGAAGKGGGRRKRRAFFQSQRLGVRGNVRRGWRFPRPRPV